MGSDKFQCTNFLMIAVELVLLSDLSLEVLNLKLCLSVLKYYISKLLET